MTSCFQGERSLQDLKPGFQNGLGFNWLYNSHEIGSKMSLGYQWDHSWWDLDRCLQNWTPTAQWTVVLRHWRRSGWSLTLIIFHCYPMPKDNQYIAAMRVINSHYKTHAVVTFPKSHWTHVCIVDLQQLSPPTILWSEVYILTLHFKRH